MFAFFYNIALHFLALLYAPVFLFQMAFRGKYRKNFLKKCGFSGHYLRKKAKAFVIWVHAPSLGETKAVAPLVAQLRRHMPEAEIIFSNVTETGHETALAVIKEADSYIYLPFDLPYFINPLVDAIKPDLVIISETDFWYNFLARVKGHEARVVVVNGKISERSLKRYLILPWLMAPLFQLLDLVCPQNEDYKERFMRLGIPPDHLYVTGNLKLDDTYQVLTADEVLAMKKRLGLGEGDLLLAIGSTHHPEEKQLLSVLKKVWRKCPELKVALVPRHPERFKTVAHLFETAAVPFATYSEEEKFGAETRLMLFDAMGILRALYQVADIAIVAGSYTDKVGGHNLLEPAWYGKPVLFGPHTEAQREMALMMKRAEAGKQVPLDKLADALVGLIYAPEKRRQMGESGVKIFAEARGATERTWQLLRVMISQILWEKETRLR